MNRRHFLTSVAAVVAAPAIVQAGNIMRVKPIITPQDEEWSWLQVEFSINGPERRFLLYPSGKREEIFLGSVEHLSHGPSDYLLTYDKNGNIRESVYLRSGNKAMFPNSVSGSSRPAESYLPSRLNHL